MFTQNPTVTVPSPYRRRAALGVGQGCLLFYVRLGPNVCSPIPKRMLALAQNKTDFRTMVQIDGRVTVG